MIPAGGGQRRRSGLLRDAGASLLLLVLAFALYRESLGLWWQGDDFHQLLFAHEWDPVEYCLDPEVWRQLPFRMLTPLLFLSFEADLALFGVEPRPFYGHQLAALALAALAALALLRLWLPVGWAALGSALLLLGPPLATTPAFLPVRHYLEGLALALAAAWLYVRAVRAPPGARGPALASLSALAWLAASLAKEVFVPLVVLLPLVPEGRLAARLARLVPHAAALGAYLAYRRFLVGTWLGGYGFALEPDDVLPHALRLPFDLGREMAGAAPLAGVAALLLLLLAAGAAARRRGGGALLAAGALAAALPVLPVSSDVEPRYAIAAWAGLAIAAPLGLAGRRGGAAAAVAALGLVLVTGWATWRQDLARARRVGGEAQAVLSLPAGALLRQPAAAPSSLAELRRFAPSLLGRPVAAGWFYDDAYLCLTPEHGRLWEYDAEREAVAEITDRRASLRRAACAALRRRDPLAARFESDGRILRWRLGPYREGTWSFVLADGREAFVMPARGAFHLQTSEVTLRVKHESPAGRIVYSPPLRVEMARGAVRTWRRP